MTTRSLRRGLRAPKLEPMRRFLFVSACVPLFLLGACATVKPEAGDAVAPAAADSAYGLFLAGSSALTEGRNSDAARFLELARTQGGDDPAVSERAFTAALMAGDIEKAALLAPDGPTASDQGKRMGRLVRAVQALTVNKGNTDSIAVYLKSGFVVREEAVFDIGSGYVMDDYVMEKRL